MQRDIDAARAVAELREETDGLEAASKELVRVTRMLLEAQIELGLERALAESTAYLDAFGTIDFTAGKLAASR